jgi:hypothetical protein
MKYNKLTLGQVETILNMVGGLNLIPDILAQRLEIRVLPKQALCTVEDTDGTLLQRKLRDALRARRLMQESDHWGLLNLNSPSSPMTKDLVAVQTTHLGLKEGESHRAIAIKDAGIAMGLLPCPPRIAVIAALKGFFDSITADILIPLDDERRTYVHGSHQPHLSLAADTDPAAIVNSNITCIFARA